jgi:hypothetical protein
MEAKNMIAVTKQRQAVSEKIRISAAPTMVPAGLGKCCSVKSVFIERKVKKNEKQASNKREKAIPIVVSFCCGFLGFMRCPLYNMLDNSCHYYSSISI